LFSAIAYKLKNPSKKARPPQLTSLEGLNKKKSFCCGGNIRQKYKLKWQIVCLLNIFFDFLRRISFLLLVFLSVAQVDACFLLLCGLLD
tara:strand:+ start:1539 stop:1805 length:267 start_codon:yes stop_codon:yes gene_type:complete